MILNCTPHQLNVHTGGQVLTLPPSGVTPRLAPCRSARPDTEGIETVHTELGSVQGLPDPVEGTFLIVSALVLGACPEREDLRSPGEAVRDASGVIVGCKGLCS